ncbi:hypothetical protein ACFQZS_08335 [Mucilaginibacter calamicampi]|uniref:Uncharacterized protein n=1 Tax=Mucilaginibacter calamicampi TaxID=1302352 RepID=A0ABW2YWB3_9SPHI
MKKFLIACFIIFIAGVGCKKTNIDGGGLCGCSPIQQPELMLVIKNAAGADLLSDKNAAAYAKSDIQLFKKDANGNATQLAFYIRPPFSYGNENFAFNTLYTAGINTVKQSGESIYLKLGNEPVYELKLQFNTTQPQIDKLFINNSEADKDNGTVGKYADIFYLTK